MGNSDSNYKMQSFKRTCRIRIRIRNVHRVIRPKTIIHQDLSIRELVPSTHKRSKLRNWIFCTLRSRDKGICQGIPISYSLGEETGLYQSPQLMGFEMPGNDDSWYACLLAYKQKRPWCVRVCMCIRGVFLAKESCMCNAHGYFMYILTNNPANACRLSLVQTDKFATSSNTETN